MQILNSFRCSAKQAIYTIKILLSKFFKKRFNYKHQNLCDIGLSRLTIVNSRNCYFDFINIFPEQKLSEYMNFNKTKMFWVSFDKTLSSFRLFLFITLLLCLLLYKDNTFFCNFSLLKVNVKLLQSKSGNTQYMHSTILST